MHASQRKNNFYGVPFQVTIHNLCYRKDFFLINSLSSLENIIDVLKSIKILHKPEKKFYGISLPGSRMYL